MLELKDSLRAWGSAQFAETLKRELARHAAELPLQQALAHSSHVVDAPITVMVNGVEETEGGIHARVGVFYTGGVSGCSCANDPTPDSEQPEYCELRLDIDRVTAATTVTLLER